MQTLTHYVRECVCEHDSIYVSKMKMNRFFAAKYKCMFIKQHFLSIKECE